MKRKTILIAVGALAVSAVAAKVILGGNEEELLEVQTAAVNLETIVQEVNATGRIQPKTQIRISADVSAKIIALHVEEGDFVETMDASIAVSLTDYSLREDNARILTC